MVAHYPGLADGEMETIIDKIDHYDDVKRDNKRAVFIVELPNPPHINRVEVRLLDHRLKVGDIIGIREDAEFNGDFQVVEIRTPGSFWIEAFTGDFPDPELPWEDEE